MNGKRLTIFGGTGFIGRHCVRRLARDGWTIRLPTRDREKGLMCKPAGDVGQIVPLICNVRSDDAVATAIGNSDAVINLIGILFEKGRNTFEAMHVETAARIARLAKEQGVKRFLQISALGAGAEATSAYARSKAAGERAVRAFFPEATILRPSIVFGPEDNFFNLFAALARYSPFLPLIGAGLTKFQPVYVGNVAEAVALALSSAKAKSETFELGGPEILSFRALLELMMRETGRKRRFVNLSFARARTLAVFHELLPNPLLTRDQVELLKADNVIVDKSAKTLRDLGVLATSLEVILPTYLDRFRTGGPAKAVA